MLGRQVGDRWSVGTSLRFLGLVALAQGDAARAQELLRKSLQVHWGFVAGWDIARSLIYLAQAARGWAFGQSLESVVELARVQECPVGDRLGRVAKVKGK